MPGIFLDKSSWDNSLTLIYYISLIQRINLILSKNLNKKIVYFVNKY